MATGAINPIVARQLVQKLAAARGGGAPTPGAPAGMPGQPGQGPGGPGGPGGGDSGDLGDMVASQSSELSGADPQFLLKTVEQMKGMAVAIYVRTSFQVPAAARHIAQAQKSLDAAIKELQGAAATQNVVRPPIANRATLPNPTAVGAGDTNGPGF